MSFFNLPSWDILTKIVLSIAMGAFLGIRREIAMNTQNHHHSFIGFRTSILVVFSGAISTIFSEGMPWGSLVFFLFLSVLVALAYGYGTFKLDRPGITTEVSTLLTFWIGVMIGNGLLWESLLVTMVLAYCNGFKDQTEYFIKTLTVREWNGVFEFLLLSAVLFPFLPKTAIDPFGILVPSKIWLIIILISGLGFLGYFLIKYLGKTSGIPLTAFLGALASSTAITTSFCRQSQKTNLPNLLTCGLLIALGTMQFRIALEILAFGNQEIIKSSVAIPCFMGIFSFLLSIFYFLKKEKEPAKKSTTPSELEANISSPFEIKPALIFGFIYVIVLSSVALGKYFLGNSGIYAASFLSAIVDVDAIVLSSVEALNLGKMSLQTAQNTILIALITNTAVKLFYVSLLGSHRFFRRSLTPVILSSASGVVALLLF